MVDADFSEIHFSDAPRLSGSARQGQEAPYIGSIFEDFISGQIVGEAAIYFRDVIDRAKVRGATLIDKLMGMYDLEEDVRKKERIVTALGWLGGHLSEKQGLEEEERQILLKATQLIEGIIRTDNRLGLAMTARHAIVRIKTEENTKLLNKLLIDSHVVGGLEGDQSNLIYRNYAYNADLTETIVDELVERGHPSSLEAIRNIAESDQGETTLRSRVKRRTQEYIKG